MPVLDIPISTIDDKCLYFNTISGLSYIDNGHGISLTDYSNHFIMVFDLTSTQQASQDFIHRELTNCSTSIELKFWAALPSSIKILIIGKKAGTIFVDSVRRVFNQLMDKGDINDLIQKCRKLKYRFRGVFADDNSAKLVFAS